MTEFNFNFQRAKTFGHNLSKVDVKQSLNESFNHAGYLIALHEKNVDIPREMKLKNHFTQAMFVYDKASNAKPLEVGFDSRAWYMSLLNDKATRKPLASRYFKIPTNYARSAGFKKDAPGKSHSLRAIKAELKLEGKLFLIKYSGGLGLFTRTGKLRNQIQMVYKLEPSTTYKKNEYFDFQKHMVNAAHQIDFESIMIEKLQKRLGRL